MTRRKKQLPEDDGPPNPFRLISVKPRKNRKRVGLVVTDSAGPDTPVNPWDTQPGLTAPPPITHGKLLTEALKNEFMTPDDAAEFAAVVKLLVLRGDLDAIKWVTERLEGKVVTRSESGKAGEFSSLEEALKDMDPATAQNIIEASERFKTPEEGVS